MEDQLQGQGDRSNVVRPGAGEAERKGPVHPRPTVQQKRASARTGTCLHTLLCQPLRRTLWDLLTVLQDLILHESRTFHKFNGMREKGCTQTRGRTTEPTGAP